MKIRYLGTAAAEGWPGLFCNCDSCRRAKALGGKDIRTRSQAVIDETLLVDFPPDTYLHMLRDGLDLPRIREVLITHTHADHLYLEDVVRRTEWYANGVEGIMTLYGNDTLGRKLQAFRLAQREKVQTSMDKVIAYVQVEPFIPVQVGEYLVTPLLASHDRSERCYLYLIEKDGKTLLYGNDTGIFPEETWEALCSRKLDLVSLDCTFLAKKEGTNHMGIPDVFEVQDRMRAMNIVDDTTQCIITHFSHNGRLLHAEIEEAVAPRGIKVAFDGYEASC